MVGVGLVKKRGASSCLWCERVLPKSKTKIVESALSAKFSPINSIWPCIYCHFCTFVGAITITFVGVSRCSELVYIELSYYFVPTAVLKKERSGLRD